jgi:probable addiction module antidote protein
MPAKKRRKEKFSPYDAAGHLQSKEDIVAYLDACMEDGDDDPALLAAALGDIARSYGMVRLARETGSTRMGLYKALSADGNPTFGTALKVLKALGVKLVPQVA